MPYAAKDIFVAPDRRPAGGLAAPLPIASFPPAEVLRRLDAAGGTCIGFTALTELAYEPSGYNVRGSVKNPWNLEFITGGSSSGSAAAVASGSVIVALGSDTGGSLRIPAHACGVTSWKPSYGLVPTSGAMALAPSLETVGLMARSALDMRPAAGALTAHTDLTMKLPQSAVVLSDVLDATEQIVSAACRDGIDAIGACGVGIEQRAGLAAIEALDPALFTIMQAEATRVHHGLTVDGTLDPSLKKRLDKGLKIDDRALAEAVAARAPMRAAFLDQVFGSAEVVILPVMPIRTPPTALCDPTSPSFDAKTLYQLSRWTRFVNLLGLPAVALPVGFDDRGMPVAMQILGRPHSDLALIALAVALQGRTHWHGRVPTGVADLAVAMRSDEVS